MEGNPVKEFAHYALDEEVRAIGGAYTLTKEDRFGIDGGEVLYYIGYAVFDTSCCGAGGCGYAIVPGFISSWHHAKDESGRPISLLIPIRDAGVKEKIQTALRRKEMVQEVRFE